MNKNKVVKFVRCSAFALGAVVLSAGLLAEPSYAASKTKKIKNLYKAKGLGATPSMSKSVNKSGSSRSGQLISAAATAAPNLVDLMGESSDLDGSVFGGSLARIIGNTATTEDCNNFFRNMGTCNLLQSTAQGFASVLQTETTMCYLSKIGSASAGVSWDGTGAAADAFDPGANVKHIKINISGFPQGQEGEGGGGGGPEAIIVKVLKQSSSLAYGVDLSMCNPETGERTGFDRIRIKNDGKITIVSAGGQGGDKNASSFSGYVAPSSNGKSISFDATKARKFTIEALHENGSFSGKITIDKGTIVQSILDVWQDNTRKSASKATYSGNTIATLKFLKGAFNNEEVFDSENRSYSGGALWDADAASYVASESNSLLDDIEGVNLDGEFFNEVPDGEMSVSGLPDCGMSDFDGTLDLDFSQEAMLQIMQSCEPAIRDANICWSNEDLQQAQLNFATACTQGGEGGGGPE